MRNELVPTDASSGTFEPLFHSSPHYGAPYDAAMPSHEILRRKAVSALLATGLVVIAVVFWSSRTHDPATPAVATRTPVLAMPVQPEDPENRLGGVISCVVVRSGSNLHSPADADTLADRLEKQGVRRVWVQFKQDESDEFAGGRVFFPSKIAPVADGFDDGRLLRFVSNLHHRGIEVAAWLPAFHDPEAWQRHPDWRARAVDEAGQAHEQPDWLCPRHPQALAYEASLLAEAVELTNGMLAGIYTDFIRYDDDFSCVCDSCLKELGRRHDTDALTPADLRKAANLRSPLWHQWISVRGDAIHDALDTMRDHLAQVDDDIWFGASVLPFSAVDYSLNTQSGQDLGKMCRAGVDEIVLMGYWDDWEKSPGWLVECVRTASEQVNGEAVLSCLLDADMSLRRTMLTLDALKHLECPLAWFNYGSWNDGVLTLLHRARSGQEKEGGMPAPPFTAVTIRIDTEPDYQGNLHTVNPEMIGKLLDLFAEEKVPATFVTTGRLATMQTGMLKRAVREGHEIAGHGYDHEQIDSLSEDEQVRVIDRTLDAFASAGIAFTGFGAPRNSITDAARDRLIERGIFYDGSLAFDPFTSYEDARLVAGTKDPQHGLVLVPFIVPNDWDARRVQGLSARQMLDAWCRRLDLVASSRELCFVLDVHQWLITEPDNFEALRGFIRTVKARNDCRFLTLDGTARHVLREIQRLESAPFPE